MNDEKTDNDGRRLPHSSTLTKCDDFFGVILEPLLLKRGMILWGCAKDSGACKILGQEWIISALAIER